MLVSTSAFFCNFSCFLLFIMSKHDNRSRSPKDSTPEESNESIEDKIMSLWKKQIEPLLDEESAAREKQNEARETALKGLVVGLVSSEVNRLEGKMDTGFVEVHSKVDSGFVEVDKKFGTVNEALVRIENAIASNPAPAPFPPPPGGSQVPRASGAAGSQSLSAPSYAGILASPLQQPVANDVTTPSFNRRTNPTKLFTNFHGRAKGVKDPVLCCNCYFGRRSWT